MEINTISARVTKYITVFLQENNRSSIVVSVSESGKSFTINTFFTSYKESNGAWWHFEIELLAAFGFP